MRVYSYMNGITSTYEDFLVSYRVYGSSGRNKTSMEPSFSWLLAIPKDDSIDVLFLPLEPLA